MLTFIILGIHVALTLSSDVGVEIFPEEIEDFAEGDILNITVLFEEIAQETNITFERTEDNIDIKGPRQVTLTEGGPYNVTVDIKANDVGYSVLRVVNTTGGISEILASKKIPVIRPEKFEKLEGPIQVIERVIIALTAFIMGSELSFYVFWECLKKPYYVIVGLLIQIAVMPAIGFGWGYLFMRHRQYEFLGFFLVAASPTGKEANYYSQAASPNEPLSLTLTVCSNILAIGTYPLWIYTLGAHEIYPSLPHDKIYVYMVATIANILIPILAGMTFRQLRPEAAERHHKLGERISKVLSSILLVWSSVVNYYIFYTQRWQDFVSIVLLVFTGFLLSYALGVLLQCGRANAWTIASSAAVLNAELIGLVLQSADFLKQPDKDLAKVLPKLMVFYFPVAIGLIDMLFGLTRWVTGRSILPEGGRMPPRRTKPRLITRFYKWIKKQRGEDVEDNPEAMPKTYGTGSTMAAGDAELSRY